MRRAVGIRWNAGAMRRPLVAWEIARRASGPANGDRGNIRRKKTAWLALLVAAFALTAYAQVDVEPYVRQDAFQPIAISPDGRYLAATVPKEDGAGVVILQPGDLTVTATLAMGQKSTTNDTRWGNPKHQG